MFCLSGDGDQSEEGGQAGQGHLHHCHWWAWAPGEETASLYFAVFVTCHSIRWIPNLYELQQQDQVGTVSPIVWSRLRTSTLRSSSPGLPGYPTPRISLISWQWFPHQQVSTFISWNITGNFYRGILVWNCNSVSLIRVPWEGIYIWAWLWFRPRVRFLVLSLHGKVQWGGSRSSTLTLPGVRRSPEQRVREFLWRRKRAFVSCEDHDGARWIMIFI